MTSERTETSARIVTQRDEAGAPPVIDAAFARWLADRAGQVLLGVRAEVGYADPKLLKTADDKAARDERARPHYQHRPTREHSRQYSTHLGQYSLRWWQSLGSLIGLHV